MNSSCQVFEIIVHFFSSILLDFHLRYLSHTFVLRITHIFSTNSFLTSKSCNVIHSRQNATLISSLFTLCLSRSGVFYSPFVHLKPAHTPYWSCLYANRFSRLFFFLGFLYSLDFGFDFYFFIFFLVIYFGINLSSS